MTRQARKIIVTGRVQGVGYRPFVYNRAVRLGLAGTVYNGSGKVFVHAEGDPASLDQLEHDLVHDAPPLARPELASSEAADAGSHDVFSIIASEASAEAEIHVPPDLFTCDDCLEELTGREERRFGYPFINCTQCGPRYTLITAMPYDRPNTSMAGFPLCDECRAEYENPADRRFHAQPLACPVCGPRLQFVPNGRASLAHDQKIREQGSLLQAIEALEAGHILAVKGVGGYHLVCDAGNEEAVMRLRERKRRPHKPLAVMFPLEGKDGLGVAREYLELDETTASALTNPSRPIVLARIWKSEPCSRPEDSRARLALTAIAPGLRELGAFLPYSPLHHELLSRFGRPVVATSGNISGEPVITDNAEAEQRLSQVADAFLHHNRPIVRPADDPVVRPMQGRVRPIRLGRGIAPLEVELPGELTRAVLATGGHMKDTVALAWKGRMVVSPHIGDLDSPRSNDVFNQVIIDLQNLYDVKFDVIACDLHPGYASSRWAEKQDLPLVRVQHHAAHASALAGEHPDVDNWLVFTWDGVGYGDDGTLWGGEALAGAPGRWTRAASFRPFKLVGGDKAGREPWRSAAAMLWAEDRDVRASLARDLELARQAWKNGINTFESSAVGRIFDAAAALVLGRTHSSFEGQGPMELEQVAVKGCKAIELPLVPDENGVLRSDWAPLLPALADESVATEERAGLLHETMARALLAQALEARKTHRIDAIGLSGGVFQNRFLTERVVELLNENGLDVRLHEKVPANDGGLSYGQVIEALALQGKDDGR
jgi:hydrogenase maturation protein HypF